MGREIVYCCKCQRRILGDELEKGTASRRAEDLRENLLREPVKAGFAVLTT
jgi:hypothetical protein